jgi:uncharacterized protein (TIGR02117 family)
MRRLIRWSVFSLFGAALLYFVAALLLGFVPGTARPAVGPRDYAFFACDNGVHVDLVLPAVGAGRDWFSYFPPQDFAGDVIGASHVALGWGARDFYVATPRWGDIRPWPTLRALFWLDQSVLHVTYVGDPTGRENCRALSTDAAGREALFAFVDATLGDRPRREEAPGYEPNDAFYAAAGRYSLFRTCNIWTVEALQAAGLPMAPWMPFSFQVMWQLDRARR